MTFKVAVAQFAPLKAEVAKNLDTIVEIVLQAQEEQADLVVLPEAATSGYFLEGGVLEASLSAPELVSELQHRLGKQVLRPTDLVLGFYQNDRGNLYNAAAYLELGPAEAKLKHVYQKFFLPTYGVFDEERFVSRGRNLGVLDTRFGRVGLMVCEDAWHGIMPTLCAVNGAEVMIVPAASPARDFAGKDIDNHDRYRRLFRAICEEHGVYCVNAQLCGFEGGKGFIGGSMVIDPFGDFVVQAPLAEEHLLIADIDTDLVGYARAQSPLIADLQSVWEEVKRLVDRSSF
ncbi:MAG TPA: nitrilase-related carbon-nitrogen hydrolase [Fimbriimonas sp.]